MSIYRQASFARPNCRTPELIPTLEMLSVREVLHPEEFPAGSGSLETPVPAGYSGPTMPDDKSRTLQSPVPRRMRSRQQTARGRRGGSRPSLPARYAKAALDHLNRPTYYERTRSHGARRGDGAQSRTGRSAFRRRGRDSTLIYVLDKTVTGMGGRLLRQRLLHPSCDLAEIESRLDAVQELAGKVIVRTELRKTLEGILDLERLLAKITLGYRRTPRSARSRPIAGETSDSPRRDPASSMRRGFGRRNWTNCPTCASGFFKAISDQPPVNLADGGAIADGFDAALDELRDISRNSRQFIAADRNA